MQQKVLGLFKCLRRSLPSWCAVGVIAFGSANTHANERIDWGQAERGIRYLGHDAFGACVNERDYPKSDIERVAMMQAQANLARSVNLQISGHEQLKDGVLSTSISESTNARIKPTVKLTQATLSNRGNLYFCVLIAESSLLK